MDHTSPNPLAALTAEGRRMTGSLPAGPYRKLQVDDRTTAPWYILPFDNKGRTEAPATRDALLTELLRGGFTDVYLFSHGWNNAWKEASGRYGDFTSGYMALRRKQGLRLGRPYRPLLIGVFWPSAALVMPWERGPQFAATDAVDDGAVEQERREIGEIASELEPGQVERFYELARHRDRLSPHDLDELAQMLAPLLGIGREEQPKEPDGPTPEELVALWTAGADAGEAAEDDEDVDPTRRVGTVTGVAAPSQAAGGFGVSSRDIVRQTTVWLMKDRAGTVGARGVGPLLHEVLRAAPDAKVHLAGHSYGGKVLLSALCYERLPAGRKVTSVLLLQPAVNHLCFAADATGQGQSGGYRAALERVEQPILSTFSAQDVPLTKLFHLAVRRGSDLGEARIAGEPPSRYAALGGYGPGGLGRGPDGLPEGNRIRIRLPGEVYDLRSGGVRVYGVDGTGTITGHGEISNPATWWALWCQVAAGGA
jgi:pimeloyl-ACP methyl ester carboxylesterase